MLLEKLNWILPTIRTTNGRWLISAYMTPISFRTRTRSGGDGTTLGTSITAFQRSTL